MKLKKTLTAIAFVSIVPLFSMSLAACSHSEQAMTHSDRTQADLSTDDHSGMSGRMHMDLGPADETFDLRFIDGMTLHHQGAIAMAEEALEKSDRSEIQQLSQDIIAAQQQEIEQMQEWRKAWYADAGVEPMMYHAEMRHMMPMSEQMQSEMMMNPGLGAADEQFDSRFINAMVPHHEGALTMAQEALEKSDRPEIQQLAQSILESQQPEIDQMKQWQQEWYGQ